MTLVPCSCDCCRKWRVAMEPREGAIKMSEEIKFGHGGKRAGAGRKPKPKVAAPTPKPRAPGVPCIHGGTFGTCRKLGCVAEARRGATS